MFLICCLFACLQEQGQARGGQATPRAAVQAHREAPTLDLAPLPTGLAARPWAEVQATHLGGDECAVCTDSFRSGRMYVKLRCRHTYCKECLCAYLAASAAAAHVTCPECRGAIC